MERRTAIRNLLIIAGGTMLLPSCFREGKKVSIPLNHLKVSGDQENLLSEISETLIPQTDIPGAKQLGVHQYVLVMVDDCVNKDDQEKFIKGLDEVNERAKKQFNQSFSECTIAQRENILKGFEKKESDEKDNAAFFYGLAKRLTIEGYLKSKYIMTNVLKYELVPGRFHGSVPLNNTKPTLVSNG
jgi:Gluconate 2-dehydrogenase subunit 3